MMLKIKSSNYYIEEFKKMRAVSQKYFSMGPTTIVDETFIGVGVPKKIVWEDDSIRGILFFGGYIAALSFADADIKVDIDIIDELILTRNKNATRRRFIIVISI